MRLEYQRARVSRDIVSEMLASFETMGFNEATVYKDKASAYEPHARKTKIAFGCTDYAQNALIPILESVRQQTGVRGYFEGWQVLKYGVGDMFQPHLDAFGDSFNDRKYTVMVCLQAAAQGGATNFTKTNQSYALEAER